MQRLRVFHVQSVRAMCRVPRKHTWEHHISSAAIARGTSCPGHAVVPWAHSPIWSRQDPAPFTSSGPHRSLRATRRDRRWQCAPGGRVAQRGRDEPASRRDKRSQLTETP